MSYRNRLHFKPPVTQNWTKNEAKGLIDENFNEKVKKNNVLRPPGLCFVTYGPLCNAMSHLIQFYQHNVKLSAENVVIASF